MNTPDSPLDPEEVPPSNAENTTTSRLLAKLPELMSDVVIALLALVLFIAAPGEALKESYPRFWACLALSLAVGVMSQWLVTDSFWGKALLPLTAATGVVIGILWERRA